MAYLTMNSPFGPLTIFEDNDSIIVLEWGRAENPEPTALLETARDQLDEYFDAKRKDFDLPLAPRGTAFQCAVWDQMRRIPYGQVKTYGDVARSLNSAPRAVGGACGRNPIPIIVPCHRIIASNGNLGGFSGFAGPETKRALLRLEGYSMP
ncbi:MAG: methylated-DNA--[protein]-cysteine S-methyltransferase [Alphaproteobacteria bacterium]|nr:methylated-DNA--[protein]-cysteine S-methyltransferase [Alphaproteobacteria bacterium]